MKETDVEQIARDLTSLLDMIERGYRIPDPIGLMWAAAVMRDCGELALSTRCVDVCRRLLPNLSRNLV